MIELQKLVDRIEEEFDLTFQRWEDYYYLKEESKNFLDLFTIDGYGYEVDVRVRLSSILDVEIHYVIYNNHQIDEFIYRLKKVILATT